MGTKLQMIAMRIHKGIPCREGGAEIVAKVFVNCVTDIVHDVICLNLAEYLMKKADSDKDVRFMMVPSIEKGTCCGHILFLCVSH